MKSVKLIVTAVFTIALTTTVFSQMYVKNNGYVGIGTNNPGFKLHVVGNGYFRTGNNAIRLLTNNPGIEIGSSTDKIDFWYSNIGHNKLYAQQFYKVSDSTLKTNIVPLCGSLNTIMQLKTYSYAMKESTSQLSTKEYGFLSQEVEKILPELTSRSKGILMIDYDQMIPILVNAMKEQQKEIEILKKLAHLQEIEIIKLKNHEENATLQNNNKASNKTAILYDNTPNPFKSETTIKYFVHEFNSAQIIITDLQGKEIKTYELNTFGEGYVKVLNSQLHKGLFIYTLVVDNKIVDTKKMILN